MISQYTLTVGIIITLVLLHGIAMAADERSSSFVHIHTSQLDEKESLIAVEKEELVDEISSSYSSSPSLNMQKHNEKFINL